MVKGVVFLPMSIIFCFCVSTGWAAQRMSRPSSCDRGMNPVKPDEFAAATKVGDTLVVSYKMADSTILRIQQGPAVAIKQNFGGLAIDALMDIQKSSTSTPEGKTMSGVFRDMDIFHKAVHFSGIEGDKLVFKNMKGEDEKMPFVPNTKFCVKK